MGKIIKKKYYKISFKLVSPMNIGYGEGERTDRDIIKNSAGKPYIPASSIAGVLKDLMSDDDNRKKYFGYIEKMTSNKEESRIIFYDANIRDPYHISIRDSVGLDEYKTAKKGAKFDMEVLEAGAEFDTYIEQSIFAGDDENYIDAVVRQLALSGLSFGSKGTRGYGTIEVSYCGYKAYDLSVAEEVNDWLDFDVFTTDNWNPIDILPSDDQHVLTIKLSLKSGLSLRSYSTKPRENIDDVVPDMVQLESHTKEGGVAPVIPGTTWAGAIRHRMKEFGASVDFGDLIFGMVKNHTDEKKRSDICFGESVIEGSKDIILSRNSIDRFTGGTANTALFTEKTCYGGATDLKIRWNGKERISDKDAQALAATLTDLHYGILAIGGETSIGRGLFSIMEINGNPVPENGGDIYKMILSKIEEVFA